MSNKSKAIICFVLAWLTAIAGMAFAAWLFDRPFHYQNPWVFWGFMMDVVTVTPLCMVFCCYGMYYADRSK